MKAKTVTYRLSITGSITVPANRSRSDVARAIVSEWWLDTMKDHYAELPLGINQGYEKIVYGDFKVRVR